jgi:hypothetical protein
MNQVLCSEDYSLFAYKELLKLLTPDKQVTKRQALINTNINFFLSTGKNSV